MIKLKIENISIQRRGSNTVVGYEGACWGDATYLFNITFEDGKMVEMYVYKIDGEWFPAMIEHPSGAGECPLCGTVYESYSCKKFRPFMQELFEDVMNRPEIRIKKIFS